MKGSYKKLRIQLKICLKNLEYLFRKLRKIEIKNLKFYKSGM